MYSILCTFLSKQKTIHLNPTLYYINKRMITYSSSNSFCFAGDLWASSLGLLTAGRRGFWGVLSLELSPLTLAINSSMLSSCYIKKKIKVDFCRSLQQRLVIEPKRTYNNDFLKMISTQHSLVQIYFCVSKNSAILADKYTHWRWFLNFLSMHGFKLLIKAELLISIINHNGKRGFFFLDKKLKKRSIVIITWYWSAIN